jgi:hypothetical protein
MKAMLILVLLTASAMHASGETALFDLGEYNREFNRIQKTGMRILGSWAVVNFVGNGLPALAIPDISKNLRCFILMNAGWNVVNAAIAGVGYFACCRKESGEFTLDAYGFLLFPCVAGIGSLSLRSRHAPGPRTAPKSAG